MSGRFYQTQFYLDQLKPLVDGKIINLMRTGEDGFGEEFYGLSVRCKDGAIRHLIILSDDEGNGPGSFQIVEDAPHDRL